MTAVLSIYADGRKGPIHMIGSSNRSKSFPKGFDPLRELEAHYVGKSNSWFTQHIWAEFMNDVDEKCGRQF